MRYNLLAVFGIAILFIIQNLQKPINFRDIKEYMGERVKFMGEIKYKQCINDWCYYRICYDKCIEMKGIKINCVKIEGFGFVKLKNGKPILYVYNKKDIRCI